MSMNMTQSVLLAALIAGGFMSQRAAAQVEPATPPAPPEPVAIGAIVAEPPADAVPAADQPALPPQPAEPAVETTADGEPLQPPSAGDQPPQPADPLTDVASVEQPAEGADASVRTSETGTQLISISLDDVPLEDVVKMFTRISGANIIASGTNLEGTVTVNLVDVEWKPALSSILDMHSLALTEKTPGSGVYSIVPKQTDVPEPLIVETVFLNYTTVNDVLPVVKSMLAQGGSVSPFNSRNAMVLRTTAGNLGEVRQILKLIDIPGQQVCIETQFMELSDSASKNLGIRWDSLDSFGARLGLGPFKYDRTTQTDNSKTDTYKLYENSASTDALNALYDVNGNQYQIAGGGVIATPTRTITDSTTSGEDNSTETINKFTESITESQSAILDLDSFNVILSALKKTEGVSIISNPKLIVANGEQSAFFSVGTREPIIKTEITRATVQGQEDLTSSQLDTEINTEYIKEGYLETGITLKVAPVIKSEGLIEALITPSLRRKTGDKTVGDNSWPIIDVKEIETRFTLKDGQTVAIGGLTSTDDSKKTSKIPLLGDIPLIGKYLFSHTSDSMKKVETIIFVTLSLAQPDSLNLQDGIPVDAELIHKRMIQDDLRRKAFFDDVARMRLAADEELGAPAPVAPPVAAPESAPGTNTAAAPAVN